MTNQDTAHYPLKMPPNWDPPYPSFMSEFTDQAGAIAMAVIGVQFPDEAREKALTRMLSYYRQVAQNDSISYVDLSECGRDSAGCGQIVVTCYGIEPEPFDNALNEGALQKSWEALSDDSVGIGAYREFFNMPLERFETLHSGPDHLVGAANFRQALTDPIQHHGYWGSMRDRLPDSQLDRFIASGDVSIDEKAPGHIVLKGNHNLAIIRSGQDFSKAEDQEKQEYLRDIEPVLIAGMDFLRDEGAEVNCYDCRLMRFLDSDGAELDHTYGLAYFQDLADLEKWSEKHPTHLAIFGSFMRFAPKYGENMRSRFWHEVSVIPSDSQYAEYVNCAPGTGLLGAITG